MEDSEKEYQEYQENMQKGNFLRQLYFETEYCEKNTGILNFSTIEHIVGEDTCLEYIIPESELQAVLDKLNTLKEYCSYPINKCSIVPTEADHKEYYFKDAKIIFYNGCNYIVAPTFFKTGATGDGWCIFIDE
jgi:hypothetical protein